MPMWQLRGSDMEMLRVVQEALADVAGAAYEVRDVSVVREVCQDQEPEWYDDVGPLPRTHNVFADVTPVDVPSFNALSDAEIDRQLKRYFHSDRECDDIIPLLITPLTRDRGLWRGRLRPVR